MGDKKLQLLVTLIATVFIIAVALTGSAAYQLLTVQCLSHVRLVKDAERVCDGYKEDCRYLVFTDKETFQNADSLWHWKWNSSDLHARFLKGRCFNLTVYGWRIPIMSVYRNIIDAKEVKCDGSG